MSVASDCLALAPCQLPTGEGIIMLKVRNRLLPAAAAAIAAGAIAVSGVAAAGAASRPAVSGTESFQIMSTSATLTTSSFIAHGAVFTAGGVDHSGSKTDTIVLVCIKKLKREFQIKGFYFFRLKIYEL